MTEETPSTGDEQPRGLRDQAKPAAPGHSDGIPEGQGDPGENRPDEIRDETSRPRRGAAPGRHCACCGNPLPPPTAQQKKPRKYCPDGAGGYEERHGITCGELGPAKEKYERVFGREAVPGADLEILDEQIATARRLLGPDSPLVTLFGGLTGTLTGVGDRLDGTVTEALAETARATAAEAEALGQKRAAFIERDAANDQAQQAVLDRQVAERERDTKVRAAEQRATAAEAAQRRAEIAQGKAESERDQHRGRAERADEATRIAREERDELARANVALTTQVELLTTQLREATAQAEQERERAEKATGETSRARAEAEARIEELRIAEGEKVLAAQRETIQQAEEHSARLDRMSRDHATAYAESLQQYTEALQRLAAAENAHTRLRERVRDGLVRLQRLAGEIVAGPAEPDAEPALRLQQAVTAHTELRHGVEDLANELELD